MSDNGKTANVAAALLSKDVKFYGIGNDTSISSYNSLVNIIDNNGENTNISIGDESEITEEEMVTAAVNHIVANIESDVLSKDYTIGSTISTDEKVEYKGTYSDAENDEKGNEEWTEGRLPSQVDIGKTYLVKYIVKDREGTFSRPTVISINTKDVK